ncbi:MAG: hypothetical protein JO348_07715, partial [Alphaproteobacteria bacterium]|nr:hypothetical protein [Alphaproteobacteria bacterium]
MRIVIAGLALATAAAFSCTAFAAAPAPWKIESLPENAPIYQQGGCIGTFTLKGHDNQTV